MHYCFECSAIIFNFAAQLQELECKGAEVPYFIEIMLSSEKIEEIVNSEVADSKYFVVDLQVKPGNQIQVYIDAMDGVTIDECADLSKKIEANLDRDNEDFELMVSSGGIDMPFKVIKQYEKHLGQEVEVLHKDGMKYKGVLKSCDSTGFELEIVEKVKQAGKKRKTEELKTMQMEYNDAKTVKLIIRF